MKIDLVAKTWQYVTIRLLFFHKSISENIQSAQIELFSFTSLIWLPLIFFSLIVFMPFSKDTVVEFVYVCISLLHQPRIYIWFSQKIK